MKNIIAFNEYFNNNSENAITPQNVLELKDKLVPVIATEGDEDLKKGLDFTINNIEDYNSDTFVKEMCDLFFNKINYLLNKKYPKFWSFADKGYSGNMFKGSNYERTQNMDIKEIAKLIREELNIYYPDWKFSVKISRYSGGQSMRIAIVDMPYTPYSEAVDHAYKTNTSYNLHRTEDVYNQQYIKDLRKIESICEQYNFDDSDAQTDYFHVRYYAFVSLGDEVKAKFYPENNDVKRSKELDDYFKEKAKQRKEKSDEIKKKFKYKKGDKVIYIHDKELGAVPKGEYEAVITKAPNGRGTFSNYDIRFKVNKAKRNGEIIDLEKPIYYTTTLYGDEKLKDFNE